MPLRMVAPCNFTAMDEEFKNIFKFLKSEKLSENERIQMRNVLRSVMAENPMQVSGGYTRFEYVLSYFNSNSLRPVGFAFALVLVVGIGTSYAAETALPGDPLYAVKVGFTEPIQGVLAVSPVAKAEWNTQLLSRRLSEAATLAAHGTLNDSARASLETQIALQAGNVNTNVAKMKATDEGAVAAASAESNLEASLVGHERVLAGISADLPAQAPSIAPLLHKVRAEAESANQKRKTTDKSLSTKNDKTVRAAALNQQKNAREKIKQVRVLTQSRRLQASTTAEASSSAKQIEDAITSGEQKQSEGKFGEALNAFQASIRAAQAVEVNLDAQVELGDDLKSHKESDSRDE